MKKNDSVLTAVPPPFVRSSPSTLTVNRSRLSSPLLTKDNVVRAIILSEIMGSPKSTFSIRTAVKENAKAFSK